MHNVAVIGLIFNFLLTDFFYLLNSVRTLLQRLSYVLTVWTAQSASFRFFTSDISDILEWGLSCPWHHSHLVSMNKCTKIGYVFSDWNCVEENVCRTKWNRAYFEQGGRFQWRMIVSSWSVDRIRPHKAGYFWKNVLSTSTAHDGAEYSKWLYILWQYNCA